MGVTNNLKKQVDLPIWEWSRFAPAATSTPSAAISDWSCYFVGGTPRYGYYMNGGSLYRYDTVTDSWNSLATFPVVTPLYSLALDYAPAMGYFGKAIGPGPGKNTIQMAALNGNTLVGQKIAIIGGTGSGQERTIVNVQPAVVADFGSITNFGSSASIQNITDSGTLSFRKTWIVNQWRDYQVRISFASGSNTGQNQIRKILYNSNNTLTFADTGYANITSWHFPPLTTAITAFASWYQIESSIVEVNSNWTIPPDSSSKFVVKGGGLWMNGGLIGAPFYILAYYDILADTWYYKGSQTTTLLSNTWATFENSLEAIKETEGGATTNWAHATPLTATVGSVSVGSAPYNRRTLIDASQNMRPNQFANQMIKIISGKGMGQTRTILGNSATTFVVNRDWDVIPDSTSSYQVIGDSDKLYITPSRNQSVMGAYSVENDMLTTGRQYDFGVVRAAYFDLAPQGIATVSVSAGGSGYAIGDILTLTNNSLYYGIGATVQVLTLGASNAVATVGILTDGTGYNSSSTAYATTGGGGSGCTLLVNSNTIPSQPIISSGFAGAVTKSSGGLLSVTVNTAGTGFSVGDLLTLATTGTNGVVRVTGVNSVGGVTSITIEQHGSGYTSGQTSTINAVTTNLVKNSTASDGGLRAVATGAVFNVTAITDVGTVSMGVLADNLRIGDIVYIGGLDATLTTTGQTYYGGLRTIAGTNGPSTFSYPIPGAGQSAAAQLTPTVVNGGIVTAVVNAAGSSYVVGDVLTCSTTGSGGTVRVVAVNSGAVTGVCLLTVGSGYSAGSSNTTGGSGTSCTITLTVGNGIASGSLTVTNAGQGFGIITSSSANPTYTAGTGLATVTVYNGGSGYAVGDLLAIPGGTGGIVKVLTTTATGTTPAGAILTVQIMAFGYGYATGTQIATTTLGNTYAVGFSGGDGGGSGCTINIASVGSVYANNSGTGLWANITSVTSAGAISAATVVYSGTGYTATAQTMAAAASAVFNAEASSTTLVLDLCKNWIPNELVGKLIQTQLAGPTATAQMRRIIANSSHAILVQPAITAPTIGSTKYVIFDNKSFGTESTYKGSDSSQYSWGIATGGSTSTLADAGTGINLVAVISGGTSNAVGDVLTLGTGTGGTVKVMAVTSGAVTDVSVITSGSGYTAGTTYAISATTGSGSGCTITVNSTNAKNWEVNRWAGYKVKVLAGTGVNSNPNELLIASNTANTLTLATNFTFSASPDATTVYAIMDNWGVCTGSSTVSTGGVATATTNAGGTGYRVGDILLLGTGVGGFVKVLTVSAGAVTGTVQILNPGSGYTAAATVATTCLTNGGTNNGCTITTSTLTAIGATTIWNDIYQNWGTNLTAINAPLVNKQIRAVAGSPVTGIDNAIVSVASATQLTTAALGTAPDGNTAYSIMARMPLGGAGSLGVSCLYRLYGTSVVEKARYMVSWRGNNTPTIDRYDIVQDIWEPLTPSPTSELYSLGSMFIYNGGDRVYFTTGVTGRVQYYDLTKNIIVPCSTVPYGMGAGILGSRMFIMSNSDLKGANMEYVYVMRHTGQEMWRALIYF